MAKIIGIDARDAPQAERMQAWQECRDCYAGAAKVKERGNGETYLPRPSGHDDQDYANYLARAYFVNWMARTASAMVGMVFRIPPRIEPQIDNPEDIGAKLMNDMSRNGMSAKQVAELVFRETVKVRYGGVLVDQPALTVLPSTRSEEQALGVRPFASWYDAEDILETSFDRDATGARKLSLVRLHETVSMRKPTETNPYAKATQERVRVLELVEGIYKQTLWRKVAVGEEVEWIADDPVTPLRGREPMSEIPFRIFPYHQEEIELPALHPLCEVNLAHYRNQADREWGGHWQGLPTLFGMWKLPQGEKQPEIRLGGTALNHINTPDAKVETVHFDGGLPTLEALTRDKAIDAAMLGMRMLAPEKRAAEAAETEGIRRAGEVGILQADANAASGGLTWVLRQMFLWAGLETQAEQVNVALNTDFIASMLSPQMVQQLGEQLEAGRITYEMYLDAMMRGEVVRSDEDLAGIKTQLAAERRERDDAGLEGFAPPTMGPIREVLKVVPEEDDVA